MPPVYAPEKVAEVVVGLVERPRAEVVVGGAGKVTTVLKPLLGPLGTRLAGRAMNYGFLGDEPKPETAGALFAPMRDGMGVSGGWRKGPNDGGVPLGVLAWCRLSRGASA